MIDAKAGASSNYYTDPRPELVQLVDPRGRRVLEVGCAAGAMGSALLARGALEVVGLDCHAPALEAARGRLTATLQVDLDSMPILPYPDGHFDLVTCADVLEHLVDPAAVLRHLRRWLRNDGLLLCSIPNVRHESVVLPLLVEGRWQYADWGILDRTHLRFFTSDGVRTLLAEAGFALLGKMAGVQTPRPPYVEKAAELVEALGGDPRRFLDECDVVQFVFFARPVQPRRPAEAPPPAAEAPQSAAEPPAPLPAARPPQPAPEADGPWKGSRRVRVLVAPSLEDPADCWATAFPAIAHALHGNRDVTLALALPAPLLESPPPAVEALVGKVDLDLLLTEAPSTPAGWERLIAGATVLVVTSARPELEELARRLRVEIQDARRDPALAAPPIPVEVRP